ncbi:MAG: hypothetical protein AAF688_12795 [Bacteroidota bacterium]
MLAQDFFPGTAQLIPTLQPYLKLKATIKNPDERPKERRDLCVRPRYQLGNSAANPDVSTKAKA